MATTASINKLFYFKNDIALEKKVAVIKEALEYIEKNRDKIDTIRFTAGHPFDGIYILNHKEIESDLLRNAKKYANNSNNKRTQTQVQRTPSEAGT